MLQINCHRYIPKNGINKLTVFSFKSDKEKSNPLNLPMHMCITPTPTLAVIQINSTKAVKFLQ